MKIGQRIRSFLLAAVMVVSSCVSTELINITAVAAESKNVTCTASVIQCEGGDGTTYGTCSDSVSIEENTLVTYDPCILCGSTVKVYSVICNTHGHIYDYGGCTNSSCDARARYTYTGTHTIEDTCVHGYVDAHDFFAGFYNTEYAYKGGAGSIAVYPLTVTTNNNLIADIVVTNDTAALTATETDYVYPTNTVTLTLENLPSGRQAKVTVNGVSETLNTDVTTYSFTMPSAAAVVSVELVLLQPTNTYPSSIEITYGEHITYETFLNEMFITNSDGVVSWSTSDSDVLWLGSYIDASSGNNGEQAMLAKDVGTAVLTVNIPETENYEASTATIDVTVTKRPITIELGMWRKDYGFPVPFHNDFNIIEGSLVSGDTKSDLGVTIHSDLVVGEILDAGKHTFTATASSEKYDVTVSNTGFVWIVPVTPQVVTPVTATSLVYGQALARSVISGEMNVDGAFEWYIPPINYVPNVNDIDNPSFHGFEAKFIPSNTTNYKNAFINNINVIVNKATPVLTSSEITVSNIAYGQTLADSTISGTMSIPWDNVSLINGSIQVSDKPVDGVFSWADPTIAPTVSDSGITEYEVIFTPNDTDNLNTVTGLMVKVNVAKAIPTNVATPVASDITYGDSLGDSELTPSDNTGMPGTFTWLDPTIKPSVSDSGSTAYGVVFTPDDTNYSVRNDITTTLIVNKATYDPTAEELAALSSTPITYGDTLEQSTLSNSVTPTVAGHYEWVDKTIVPTVRDSLLTEYDVVFVPDDIDNYNITTGLKATVQVNKADYIPTTDELASVDVSDLVYEQLLGDSVITGTFVTDGSFTWEDPTIKPTVADSDTTLYNVIFTDNDGNYNPYVIPTTVHVDKAMPVVSGTLTASDITYGNTLSNSVIDTSDMTTDVTGRFEWETPDLKPAVTTGTDYNVVFIPDDENYETVILPVTVVVGKVTYIPTIEELAALSSTPITYGDTLEQSTLSSSVTSAVAGHYEWADKTIVPAVRDSLLTEYDVVFVPDDVDNYDITTGLRSTVQVNKADYIPTTDELASVDVSDLVYEQTLNDSVISGTFVTDGSFSWEDPTIKPTVANSDTTPYNVIFTDNDGNYNPYVIPVTVHVDKKQFSAADFEGLHATGIYYGQTLAKSVITYTNNVCDGAFVWQDDSIMPTVADSNTTLYLFDFIPTDTDNYLSTTGMQIILEVSTMDASVSADVIDSLTATDIIYGQPLSASILTSSLSPTSPIDESVTIAGHWEWANGDVIYPTVADSHRTAYDVIFVPDDIVNYPVINGVKMTLGVNKADYVLSEAELASIKASAITEGQTLAKSSITGTIGIAGSFVWDDPTIEPTVADSDVTPYAVSFITSDPNYNSISGLTAMLTVKKASDPGQGDTGPTTPSEPSTPTIPPRPAVVQPIVPSFKILTTPICVGQSLADSVLSADGIVYGTLTWARPNIKPTLADSNTTEYDVLYTQNGISYRMKATVTVNKNDSKWDTSDYEIAEDGAIIIRKTYGDPDFSLGISAVGLDDASFTYTEEANNDTITVVDDGIVHIETVGTEDILVKFLGTDYWDESVLTVRVIVEKQTLVIPDEVILSISTTPIIYGDTLAQSTIIANGFEIEGHFEWKDTGIVPELSDSDTTEYELIFYPRDMDNYDVAEFYKATVTVIAAENDIPVLPSDDPIDSDPLLPDDIVAILPPDPIIKPDDDFDEITDNESSESQNPETGDTTSNKPFIFGFSSITAALTIIFMRKKKSDNN